MNRAILLGRVGKDPELRNTGKGEGKITRFSVATSHGYKDKEGERQVKTTWHNCVAFGKQAEVIVQYLKKGSRVAIEGRIENTSHTNDAGEKKYFSNIVIEQVEFLHEKKAGGEYDDAAPSDKKFDASKEFGDDDDSEIPF